MKKIIIAIFISLIIVGCDGITDEVVDNSQDDLKIVDIQAPSVIFYTDENTAMTATMEVENGQTIRQLWLEIEAVSGAFKLVDNLEMKDDGDTENSGDLVASDNIYTGRYFLSDQDPNDEYSVNYYYKDQNEVVKKIGSTNFTYDNTQFNYAPVISNLDMVSSIERDVTFIFSLQAIDDNGYDDIKTVYFELYRPDGTPVIDSVSNSSQFLMADNGDNDIYGDEIVGDSIFSFKNSFWPTSAQGTWTFIFRAEDRSDEISNEIIHNLEVQ